MSLNEVEVPIVVDPNQLPASAATLLRYILTALGGLLVTRDILPVDSDINALVGVALMVLSAAYGVWKTISNKKKLVTAASAAPDSVAIVK